ncbi:MAG: helix-turn-helix domain-containing protein [Gammaproteobacteria bacterium]|nr:helix-turn-helix domain-containing protein [Gammaproteobacteria bacterium]MCY4357794.1 helix-turn-helix domain-containing protein [Gammaproteobacteria bacterium]
MAKLYVVELTEEERKTLHQLIYTETYAAAMRRNAQILLSADESEQGEALSDAEVAELVGVTTVTVENVRKRFVTEGMYRVLVRAPRSRERSKVMDERAESRLISIALSKAPKGCRHWTMQMLADELVQRKIVVSISDETVRQFLKRKGIKPWRQGM